MFKVRIKGRDSFRMKVYSLKHFFKRFTKFTVCKTCLLFINQGFVFNDLFIMVSANISSLHYEADNLLVLQVLLKYKRRVNIHISYSATAWN